MAAPAAAGSQGRWRRSAPHRRLTPRGFRSEGGGGEGGLQGNAEGGAVRGGEGGGDVARDGLGARGGGALWPCACEAGAWVAAARVGVARVEAKGVASHQHNWPRFLLQYLY